MSFHRYVALGDSFTEGVGDDDPTRPNEVRGWADRMAEVLGAVEPDFAYANLAIRGRKLRGIIDEQLEPAIALGPDLVTIYAGGNDVLRPKVDLDSLLDEYEVAVGKLTSQVPTVAVFTAADPGSSPFWGALRGRWAIYNEGVREIADKHGATVIDYWRHKEYLDRRYWAEDRIHMSPAGHQQMATIVLDTLGVPHQLEPLPFAEIVAKSAAERRSETWSWTKEHAVPWVQRRVKGISSGDTLDPRFASFTPVDKLAVG